VVVAVFRTSVSTAVFQSGALGTTQSFELEDVVKKLAELGFNGIEILPYDIDEVNVSLCRTLPGGMAVSAVASGGINFHYGVTLLDLAEEKRATSLRLMKRYVMLAHEIGSPLVLIGSVIGKIEPSIDRETATRWLTGSLTSCGEYAAEVGVSLAIEPVNRYERNFLNNVEEGLGIIRLIRADNIHLLLDTFHMNIEEPSICDSLRKAGSEVVHVHVADSNRWPPGFGHLNFESISAVLKEIGYRGFLSLECLPKPDLATALEKGLRHIQLL
jgi:sugar phosphate isomerase/epimerase